MSEWLLKGQAAPARAARDDLTVNEVTLAYRHFAECHYRGATGAPTLELAKLKNTFRVLFELYGDTPARDFGPLALKALRHAMVDAGLCRTVDNSRVGRFKCAAGEQLIAPPVYHGLLCVDGLRRVRLHEHFAPRAGQLPHARPSRARIGGTCITHCRSLAQTKEPEAVRGARSLIGLSAASPVVIQVPRRKRLRKDSRALTAGRASGRASLN